MTVAHYFISAVWGVRCSGTSGPAQQAAVVEANSQRDEVNFPRRSRPIDPSPVRLGFVPQGWFDLLYPKTGVTGLYSIHINVKIF